MNGLKEVNQSNYDSLFLEMRLNETSLVVSVHLWITFECGIYFNFAECCLSLCQMMFWVYLLQIPDEITAALEPIKDNDEAVKAYGIHLGTEMCKKILASGIKTLHLYTLNMEKSALAILLVVSQARSIIMVFHVYNIVQIINIVTLAESWLD